ncbi:lipocalin family protein [Pelomonas sp. P7]|uniref:Lipocalin family protein n=1 Tax=Pelomonas caseinilytica TaxID=2906763 RepID=A0ABS8XAT7_9BURK|nr:lipocalin family protein [Pelomonas sp. P7]MCE4536305.1 lipocalin family protein [Pelomonas sp. P7]
MNPQPSPTPLHAEPPEGEGDLDTRILRVEQRLIAREERLRREVSGLARQARRQLRPTRLLAPAGGVVLAALALRSLWRRPEPATVAASAPGSGGSRLHDIPWVRLLGLGWPLLPERWRQRISPATASSLVTLGLPLVERLLGQRRATPLQAVAEADPMRLRGRWFLVGELPAALEAEPSEPPELGLLPREDGQLDLLMRRVDRHGTQGRQVLLQPVAGSHGAQFKVSHWPAALQWLPWAWNDLFLLHVDAGYDEALLGSPERDQLWLLSRRPTLDPERRQALAQIARDRGFDAGRLRFNVRP